MKNKSSNTVSRPQLLHNRDYVAALARLEKLNALLATGEAESKRADSIAHQVCSGTPAGDFLKKDIGIRFFESEENLAQEIASAGISKKVLNSIRAGFVQLHFDKDELQAVHEVLEKRAIVRLIKFAVTLQKRELQRQKKLALKDMSVRLAPECDRLMRAIVEAFSPFAEFCEFVRREAPELEPMLDLPLEIRPKSSLRVWAARVAPDLAELCALISNAEAEHQAAAAGGGVPK